MSEHALDAYEQQQDAEEEMRDRELQERHEEAQIIRTIPTRHTEDDMSEHTAAPKSTPTPAPWTVDEATKIGGVYCDDSLGSMVADCAPDMVSRPIGEIVANSRLIAAAPELYAAAKELLEWLHVVDDEGLLGDVWEDEQWAMKRGKDCLATKMDAMEEALAKAGGPTDD